MVSLARGSLFRCGFLQPLARSFTMGFSLIVARSLIRVSLRMARSPAWGFSPPWLARFYGFLRCPGLARANRGFFMLGSHEGCCFSFLWLALLSGFLQYLGSLSLVGFSELSGSLTVRGFLFVNGSLALAWVSPLNQVLALATWFS